MKNLRNLYQLQKTLRFELRPIGKTKENIEKNGLLEEDEQRAKDYKEVKKLIDEYHRHYIDGRLTNYELPLHDEGNNNSLEEYYNLYLTRHRDAKQEEIFNKVKENLRKLLAGHLTSSDAYGRIFKKELIREDLPEFVSEDKREILEKFKDFTTYFVDFFKNRKNMYTEEAKSTSIAFRLIDQNLPKFIDNMKSFEKIASSEVADYFVDIYSVWEEYLNVESIEDMFSLDYYSITLTQKQIEVYNYVIGGKSLEDGTKIKGINEYVNLYNQKQIDKSKRLPKLVPLYKQILSERTSLSWLADEFNSDAEMINAIKEMYATVSNVLINNQNDSIHSLLTTLSDYDLSQINITNDLSLTDISQKIFGRYDVYTSALKQEIRDNTPQKRRESEEDYDKRINKIFNNIQSFSIAKLNSLPHPALNESQSPLIEDYFKSLGAINNPEEQKENLIAQTRNAFTAISGILNSPSINSISQDKLKVAKIKSFLDSLKNIQHFIKPLLGSREETEKDERFYGSFYSLAEEMDIITPLYNKVRNWLTRKPYSDEKIKLNFNNSQLLGGWDQNKETDCTGIILIKDKHYYLGIMDKKHNHVFDFDELPSDGICYQKVNYKLLPGANKMLPKVFLSKKGIEYFSPSPTILENYKLETHKKGDHFNLASCHALIDFFKASIEKHEDWRMFGFEFSPTKSYQDISAFYREVEKQGYKITFKNISESYINQLVDEGKLYLFQLWNKDFSEYSHGTPNLHTLYWNMLFDEHNLRDVVYKLNGEAEVFFRKSSIDDTHKIVHPANTPIDNKNKFNSKKQSQFEYDIVKDRRYTVDKFQFHVPITLNFKAKGVNNINPMVNQMISDGKIDHIIGIDRGERHLLYLSMIDLHGNIVKQMTLNEIINEYKGVTYRTDYHNLLSSKEEERTDARKNWDTIESIKELKEGYMSQVVHIISKMMVEHNAIVVLEDLNTGFMRGRQKVERQVYEKFEKMLIDKLNYLVDKQTEPEKECGLLKALQLTNKFESFSKIGKQCGCLFYIPAWNTSKIDPVTGFVNLFDTRYDNIEKSRLFFSLFDTIRFNSITNEFEFKFNYDNFTTKAEGTHTNWTITTYGTRILTFRNPNKNNQWDSKEVDLSQEFKSLFNQYGIDIQGNLKEAINNQTESRFFKELFGLMKLMLQMRNSITGSEIDYILSPVADSNGKHFDSRDNISNLPENADANGAFNIARKGLWIVNQIQCSENSDRVKLAITNKEWLNFAQEKPYLND